MNRKLAIILAGIAAMAIVALVFWWSRSVGQAVVLTGLVVASCWCAKEGEKRKRPMSDNALRFALKALVHAVKDHVLQPSPGLLEALELAEDSLEITADEEHEACIGELLGIRILVTDLLLENIDRRLAALGYERSEEVQAAGGDHDLCRIIPGMQAQALPRQVRRECPEPCCGHEGRAFWTPRRRFCED